MVDDWLKKWFFSSSAAHNTLSVRHIFKLLLQHVLFIKLKIKHPVGIFNAILRQLREGQKFKLKRLPTLNKFLNTLVGGFHRKPYLIVEGVKNAVLFFLMWSFESEHPEEFKTIHGEIPAYEAYKENVSRLIKDILNIPRSPPEMTAWLFPPQGDEIKWALLYANYVESHDINELLAYYISISFPITTLFRAKWYQVSDPMIFTETGLVDLVFGIIFDNYKRPKGEQPLEAPSPPSPLPEANDSPAFNILTVINKYPGFLPQSGLREDLETIACNTKIFNKSPEHDNLRLALHVILTLDENFAASLKRGENDQISDQLLCAKLLESLRDSEEPQQLSEFQVHYLSTLTLDELDDILQDFIYRFAHLLEGYFRPLLAFLDTILRPMDKGKPLMLGGLLHRLNLSNSDLLQQVLIVRNSISHCSYLIEIRHSDIALSRLTFKDIDGTEVCFSWAEFVDFAEKIYEFLLGWIRFIERELRSHQLIPMDIRVLDSPSKEFALFWEIFLDYLGITLDDVV